MAGLQPLEQEAKVGIERFEMGNFESKFLNLKDPQEEPNMYQIKLSKLMKNRAFALKSVV